MTISSTSTRWTPCQYSPDQRPNTMVKKLTIWCLTRYKPRDVSVPNISNSYVGDGHGKPISYFYVKIMSSHSSKCMTLPFLRIYIVCLFIIPAVYMIGLVVYVLCAMYMWYILSENNSTYSVIAQRIWTGSCQRNNHR